MIEELVLFYWFVMRNVHILVREDNILVPKFDNKNDADDDVYNMAATKYASQNPEIRCDVINSCARIVRLIFNQSSRTESPQNCRFIDKQKCGFTQLI